MISPSVKASEVPKLGERQGAKQGGECPGDSAVPITLPAQPCSPPLRPRATPKHASKARIPTYKCTILVLSSAWNIFLSFHLWLNSFLAFSLTSNITSYLPTPGNTDGLHFCSYSIWYQVEFLSYGISNVCIHSPSSNWELPKDIALGIWPQIPSVE